MCYDYLRALSTGTPSPGAPLVLLALLAITWNTDIITLYPDADSPPQLFPSSWDHVTSNSMSLSAILESTHTTITNHNTPIILWVTPPPSPQNHDQESITPGHIDPIFLTSSTLDASTFCRSRRMVHLPSIRLHPHVAATTLWHHECSLNLSNAAREIERDAPTFVHTLLPILQNDTACYIPGTSAAQRRYTFAAFSPIAYGSRPIAKRIRRLSERQSGYLEQQLAETASGGALIGEDATQSGSPPPQARQALLHPPAVPRATRPRNRKNGPSLVVIPTNAGESFLTACGPLLDTILKSKLIRLALFRYPTRLKTRTAADDDAYGFFLSHIARYAAPDRLPSGDDDEHLDPWRSALAIRAWTTLCLLITPLILGDWHEGKSRNTRPSWRVHALLSKPMEAPAIITAFLKYTIHLLADSDNPDRLPRQRSHAQPESLTTTEDTDTDAEVQSIRGRVNMASPSVDSLFAAGAISKAVVKLTRTTEPVPPLQDPQSRRNCLATLHPPRPHTEDPLEYTMVEDAAGGVLPSTSVNQLMKYRSPDQKLASFIMSNDNLVSLLHDAPRGSAPGPCSLTTEGLHAVLKREQVNPNGTLTGLTEHTCNLIRALATGAAPKEAFELMTQCSLIGIDKTSGNGVRPIAVCPSMTRWLSRTLLNAYSKDVQSLTPFNFGVACPAGREAAIIAVAIDMHRNPDRSTLAIDLRNAFNEPSRQWLIQATYRLIPHLAPSVARLLVPKGLLALSKSCCSDSIDTEEKADAAFLESATGTRQGDPMSPLIFSLLMHFIIEEIKEKAGLDEEEALSVAYLDDWTIRCSHTAIQRVLEVAPGILASYGLRMNPDKTVVLESRTLRSGIAVYPGGIIPTKEDGINILGTPVGSDTFVLQSLRKLATLARTLGSTLPLYAQSAPQSNRPRAAMTMLRASLSQKFIHLARTVPPRLFKQVSAEFDAITADLAIGCVDEGIDTISAPENRSRHARALCFRAPAKSGLGIPSVTTCTDSGYTTAVLNCLHLWKKLADKGMSIGKIPARLFSTDTMLSEADLHLLTGMGDPQDPLHPIARQQWSHWATLAEARSLTAPRNSINSVPLASDPAASLEDDDAPTSTSFIFMPIEGVILSALRGDVPPTLQHLLTSLVMHKRDVSYDAELLSRALRAPRAISGEHWASNNEPSDRLVWLLHEEMGGTGHDWVLDSGIRRDTFGNARRGNLLLHDDAPLAGPHWVTAIRTRLIMPLGTLFRSAQRCAGVQGLTRPLCGCAHCKGNLRVDWYGLHLASIISTYTRRHHAFNEKVKYFATKAGLTVRLENYSFRTSPTLSAKDKDKHVDARVEGLSRDAIVRIDADALAGYSESELPPHLLIDYTFHHPGPFLINLTNEELAHAGDVMSNCAADKKVVKYRALSQTVSREHSLLPQLAFVPAVLSVYGRQHQTTRRFLQKVVCEYASGAIGAPSPDNEDTTTLAVNTRVALYKNRALCTLSTMVVSHLVSGMFEGAHTARSPPSLPSSPRFGEGGNRVGRGASNVSEQNIPLFVSSLNVVSPPLSV